MAITIASVTFDCCRCPHRCWRFWSAALERPLDPNASSDFAAIGFVGRRDTCGVGSREHDGESTWMFVKFPSRRPPRTASTSM